MSSVNTQFSIAVHLLANLGVHPGFSSTSAKLAQSVNAYPSFVRRVLSKLSKAGIVRTTSGKSGSCVLGKDPRKMSLLEVYRAIEAPAIFAIHDYPSRKDCVVSCGIKHSLDEVLKKSTKAFEKTLKEITLADVIEDLKNAP